MEITKAVLGPVLPRQATYVPHLQIIPQFAFNNVV